MKNKQSLLAVLLLIPMLSSAVEKNVCGPIYETLKIQIDNLGVPKSIMEKQIATFQGTSLGPLKHFIACANNSIYFEYVRTEVVTNNNALLVIVELKGKPDTVPEIAGKSAFWRFLDLPGNLSVHSLVRTDGTIELLRDNPIGLTQRFAIVMAPTSQLQP